MNYKGIELQYTAKNNLRKATLHQLRQVMPESDFLLLKQLNDSTKLCFYQGKSKLDPSKQVVGVMTYKPHKIYKIGEKSIYTIYFDPSVIEITKILNTANCGNCSFSDLQLKGCYTNFLLRQNVKKAIKQLNKNKMPMIDFNNPLHVELVEIFTHRMNNLRFGETGDPCSIPIAVHNRIDSIFARFPERVGYTHQWQTLNYQRYATIIASVNTATEVMTLESLYGTGAKYARVIPFHGKLLPNERICPQQRKLIKSCAECGLCQRDKAPNINMVFISHGTTGMDKALETLNNECKGCPMVQ